MSQNIHYTSPRLKKLAEPKFAFKWAIVLALIAGAVFSFALAPYYAWGLAIVSPAILYLCVSKRTAKQAFLIGLAYGFGLWFVGGFWLYTSIHEYGLIAPPLAVLMVAIMAVLMGLFSAVQVAVYRRFFPESPLTFAPIWVFFEWLKTWLFTGFPWLFVGYAFTERWLDNYAPVFGVLGVSFFAVLLAGACAEILQKRWFWIPPMAVVVLGAVGMSQVSFVQQSPDKPLRVSLIQGNIPQDLKWQEEHFAETLHIYQRLSEKEWGRDLVVWPESSIPAFHTDMYPFLQGMSAIAQGANSAWLTGIFFYDNETDKKYNSIIGLGDTQGYYHKQRLVPFGEYIPLAGLLYWVLPEMQKDVAEGGLSAGESRQAPFSIKGRHLAVAICYEVAYPNLTRKNAIKSDALLTISNDAWFTGTAGPWQHLQMVQMRAKENGRWFIRATNTGITVFINEHGQIVEQAPQDEQAVLRGDLPSMEGRTWYNRLGDYPILFLCVLLLFIGYSYRQNK